MQLSLLCIWLAGLITVIMTLITIGLNFSASNSIANSLNELESAQASLEDAAIKLIEKANIIQNSKLSRQLEAKHLQMRQTSRDIQSASDVMQLEEAKNVAAMVHTKLAEIRKMIGVFNDAHKMKK